MEYTTTMAADGPMPTWDFENEPSPFPTYRRTQKGEQESPLIRRPLLNVAREQGYSISSSAATRMDYGDCVILMRLGSSNSRLASAFNPGDITVSWSNSSPAAPSDELSGTFEHLTSKEAAACVEVLPRASGRIELRAMRWGLSTR
jgi:hypothetical protein